MSDENGPRAGDGESDFNYGDWVEFKLNTNLFGIVVGYDCMGLKYDVQLSPSGAIVPFFGATLRPLEESDEYVDPERETAPEEETNVIDFTRARELRVATKTKGAA